MGKREYAEEVVKFFDRGDVIIGERVISREDCTTQGRKSLDLILAEESAILILDDTASVWSKDHQRNLVRVPRYNFFSSTRNGGFELKHDEFDQGGRSDLSNTIQVLKHVHSSFFSVDEEHPMTSDTRKILQLRKNILKGCTVYSPIFFFGVSLFSHIFPREEKPESQYIWNLSESIGAQCFYKMDPQVTHVITAHPTTDKSRWASETGKFLVNMQWIVDADNTGERQSEKTHVLSLHVKERQTCNVSYQTVKGSVCNSFVNLSRLHSVSTSVLYSSC